MNKSTIELLESLIKEMQKQNEQLARMSKHLTYLRKEAKKVYWQNERIKSKVYFINKNNKRGK